MNKKYFKSVYPDYRGQVEFSTTIPKKEAEYRESKRLDVLSREKLEVDLYSHQAQTIDLFLEDKDVCLTTGTASGKTLAYVLCIAHLIRKDKKSKALLVFPTKALTRDQKEEIEEIFASLGMDVSIGVYDGDVSPDKKRVIRNEADLILTNFTGLNLYLSHHEKWSQFFENIRTVVVDEAHHYRGLLGIHVAWIIRRLRRICGYYSEEPRFFLSSATLGNPEQHSKKLVGREFEIIGVEEDGSGRGERRVIFWNPPKYHDETPERKSTHRESSELLAFLIDQGLQTLMFAPSRKMTELDALWTQEILGETFENQFAEVRSYNAGYSKEQRREIEEDLRTGDVDGVVSTTALELGINIGGIDATILSGYPGSRISFWQQIGRAGRGTEDVVSFLVPFNNSLDQYMINHPEHLLGEPIESAVIDLSNNHIYSQHLLSAAQELPLKEDDEKIFSKRLKEAAEMWKREGSLTGDIKTGYRYMRERFPQQDIDIYSTGEDNFEVQVRTEGGSIETLPKIEKNRAYRDFHPGAIYLHQGEYHQVVDFQEGTRSKVILEPVETDYYTVTLKNTDISNIELEESRELGDYVISKGKGEVKVDYFAYKKKKLSDDEVIATESTDLEPITLRTQVSWIEIPTKVKENMIELAEKRVKEGEWIDEGQGARYHYLGGLHAVEHSLIQMLPLLMLIDEKDVGGISTDHHRELGNGAVFIYDGVEGGVGFSHDAYSRIEDLAERSIQRLNDCSCQSVRGCPACTFSANCGNDNDPLNRRLAVELLEGLKNTSP